MLQAIFRIDLFFTFSCNIHPPITFTLTMLHMFDEVSFVPLRCPPSNWRIQKRRRMLSSDSVQKIAASWVQKYLAGDSIEDLIKGAKQSMHMECLGQTETSSLSTSLTTFSLSQSSVFFNLALRIEWSTNPALVVGMSLEKILTDFLSVDSWLINQMICSSYSGNLERRSVKWLMTFKLEAKMDFKAFTAKILPTTYASTSVVLPSQCFLQFEMLAMYSYSASVFTFSRDCAMRVRARQALNLRFGSFARTAPRSLLTTYQQFEGSPQFQLISPGLLASWV